MNNRDEKLIINARPTKTFFIDMLVKDIELIRSVVDLVDNCVDGALRERPDRNFNGLTVRVETDKEFFKIADNCGGIPVDLARHYAFRFGRPEGMVKIPHSIGRFGIGMKRALFKLGDNFTIESSTAESRFVVEVDVNEWKSSEEWEFEFAELEEDVEILPEDRGTTITVNSLHKSVSENFELENFRTLLAKQIRGDHRENMDRGLDIIFNGIPLQFDPLKFLHSDKLKPAYKEITTGLEGEPAVLVKLYAGVAKSDPATAGWYVFCNGRLILGADQSLTTGWGEGDGTKIPKSHPQFAMFRGYAFFESDDAGLLPWNTTKTGVDADSSIWRAIRLQMITLMRPVIDFLNQIAAEKAETEREGKDAGPLVYIVNQAYEKRVSEVTTSSSFEAPKPVIVPKPPATRRIQYDKPKDQVDQVKKALGATTLVAVGERTFDYFYQRECED